MTEDLTAELIMVLHYFNPLHYELAGQVEHLQAYACCERLIQKTAETCLSVPHFISVAGSSQVRYCARSRHHELHTTSTLAESQEASFPL